MKSVNFPFIPKSTAYMQVGQFWDIPLSNGKFACGRVLQFNPSLNKKNARSFLAGLMDWVDANPPAYETIAGAKLLEQGEVQIKTIIENGGAIRGYRALEEDKIIPCLELSQIMPTINCKLVRGYEQLRPATKEEQMSLYIHQSWGYGVIKTLAEAYFVKMQPPKKQLPWDQWKDYIDKVNDRYSGLIEMFGNE